MDPKKGPYLRRLRVLLGLPENLTLLTWALRVYHIIVSESA